MFHSRKLNIKINRLHERCLRIVYNDTNSSFNDLLKKDNSVCNHHRNLQTLAIELYKIVKDQHPKFLDEIFLRHDNHKGTRNDSFFISRSIKTTYHGSESLSFLAPKIWDLVPKNLKDSPYIANFKKGIKMWIPNDCPCRICKKYISGLGFF